MKWVEIIRLRALDRLRQTGVIALLRQIAADQPELDVTFRLYRQATIENDVSVHLTWQSIVTVIDEMKRRSKSICRKIASKPFIT